MKIIYLLLFTFISINIFSQKLIEQYKPPEGYLRIGPEQEQMLPMVEEGYTLILPESEEVDGVVIMPIAKRKRIKESFNEELSLENTAIKNNLAVLHIITGNPLDFYFDSGDISELTKNIQEILTDNELRGKPVYLFGQSLEGTRAMRLAVYLVTNREKFWLQPAAAVVIDSPLDMVRYWDELNRTLINKYNETAVDEAKQLTYLLKENLGTPQENYSSYVDYSPFVYDAEDGGNAEELRNLPVKVYFDPDVNWWIENYRKDYYSMNAVDMAGLINQLRLLNNDETELAELNFNHDSDSKIISDYNEIINWFLKFKE